jgi:hypothetical protein
MASESFDEDLDGLSIGSSDDLQLDGLSLGSDSEGDAIPGKKEDGVFFSLLKEDGFDDRDVIAAVSRDEPSSPTQEKSLKTPEKKTDAVSRAAEKASERSASAVSSPNAFDNPNFAPKPNSPRVRPENLANIEKLAASAPKNASPLPDFGKVSHSGYILARISIRTILLKKWKQVYWVTYGVNQILFFRSTDDFEEWLTNPYLSAKERDHLVKLKIDLIEDLSRVEGVAGYTVTPKIQKLYNTNNYYTFKLEKWINSGPIISAAFASLIETDVTNLRTMFLEMGKKSTLFRHAMSTK